MSANVFARRPAAAPAEGAEYDTHPELALAAVLQMLSRFPARRSPALAQAIDRWRPSRIPAQVVERYAVERIVATYAEELKG